jgi:chromosome segregation ATPase
MKTTFVAVVLIALLAVVFAAPNSRYTLNLDVNTLDKKFTSGINSASTLDKKFTSGIGASTLSANTLTLQGEYEAMVPVIQIIDNQIAGLREAIAALEAAVQQANVNQLNAKAALDAASASEGNARQRRDAAQAQFDAASQALKDATAALDQAERELAQANQDEYNASNDYKKKEGAVAAAQKIYDAEYAFKLREIAQFQAILTTFGTQNGAAALAAQLLNKINR